MTYGKFAEWTELHFKSSFVYFSVFRFFFWSHLVNVRVTIRAGLLKDFVFDFFFASDQSVDNNDNNEIHWHVCSRKKLTEVI